MSTTTTATNRQVNGDSSSPSYQSAFISHLLHYPLISDSISTIKSNEYGQRSIKLGDSAYQTFAHNVMPWFAKPYEYVSPYVAKADSIGDQGLSKIDERFPVVKKPTNDIYKETRSLVLTPYYKGIEGRDHIFQVYNSEFSKNERPSLVAHGKAAVTTALVVSNETLEWLSSFLKAKKEETNQTISEKTNQ